MYPDRDRLEDYGPRVIVPDKGDYEEPIGSAPTADREGGRRWPLPIR